MAFKPQFTPDEKIEGDFQLLHKKKECLRLVLTDRAAYWAGRKFFALRDDVTVETAAIAHIQEVQLGRTRKLPYVICGIVLALACLLGLVMAFRFEWSGPRNRDSEATRQSYHLFKWVGLGVFVALAGRRRWFAIKLRPHVAGKGLRFKLPLTGKQDELFAADAVLAALTAWAQNHDIPVKYQGKRLLAGLGASSEIYDREEFRKPPKGRSFLIGLSIVGAVILSLMAMGASTLPPRDRHEVLIAIPWVAGVLLIIGAVGFAVARRKN